MQQIGMHWIVKLLDILDMEYLIGYLEQGFQKKKESKGKIAIIIFFIFST